MSHSNRLAAIFPTLRANIFGRIGCPQNQDVLLGEFAGLAKIMGVQYPPIETFKPFVMWHIRYRKMPRRNHNVIKGFRCLTVLNTFAHRDFELITDRSYVPHNGAKLNCISHISLFHSTFDIIHQDCARGKGCNGFSKVLIKAVIRKLKSLFGAVRPKISIHRPVAGIAIFIQARAPRIPPQTAPVSLFFVANNLNVGVPLIRVRLKGP